MLINLQYDSKVPHCFRVALDETRSEAQRSLIQLTFFNQVPATQVPSLRRYFELGKITPPDFAKMLKRRDEDLKKLQKDFVKEQLQSFVKQQQQQQRELASIWRDLMKIEDETLIRKMNDPNPMVSMMAIQVAGKKRLPVEKEAIGLLSSVNPAVRQAARQTLMRLGRGVDYGPDATASPQQVALSMRNWNSWLDVQGTADEEDDYDPPRTKSVGQTK